MAVIPKDTGDKFFPGAGQQWEWGLVNVGYTVVDTTIVANTVQTDAQLVAAPPNTASPAVPCGPIVHSLGTPPAWTALQLKGGPTSGFNFGVQFQYVTADNSAIYYRAMNFTGTAPAGVAVRAIAVR